MIPRWRFGKSVWKMGFNQALKFELTLEFYQDEEGLFFFKSFPFEWYSCKALQKCTQQISRVSHNEIVVWDISSRKSSGARVKTYLRCPSTSAIFYLPLLAFILEIIQFQGSKISVCFWKSEKRNDRVSGLDSWTTKRWSGAHHQLFFSVNNDLSTGCEKQSEKIKLRLLLLVFWEITGWYQRYNCKVCLYLLSSGGGRQKSSIYEELIWQQVSQQPQHCCWDAYLLCAESHLKNIQ